MDGAPAAAPPRLEASIVGSSVAETVQLNVASVFALTSSHVVYTIRSSWGGDPVEVQRRFSEFETVHAVLAEVWLDADGASLLPEYFPVSKLRFHTEYELNERKKALQLYLRGVAAVVEHDAAGTPHAALLEFLGLRGGEDGGTGAASEGDADSKQVDSAPDEGSVQHGSAAAAPAPTEVD